MSGSYVNSDIVYADDTSATLSAFPLSGNSRMLVVFSARPFSPHLPTALTVGGVAMKTAASVPDGGSTSVHIAYLGEADLPANGTEDIVVTYDTLNDIVLSAVLLNGVKDQGPEAVSAVAEGVTGATSFNSIADDPAGLATYAPTSGAAAVAFAQKRFAGDMTFTGDFIEREESLNVGGSGWALTHITSADPLDFGATWGTTRDHGEGIIVFAADTLETTLGPAVIKRPWTKQPPAGTKIDWSNPLTKGLKFLWAGPHTGGSYGRDLVSGRQMLLTAGGTNAPERGVEHQYRVMTQAGGGDARSVYLDNLNIPEPEFLSVFAVFRHTTGTNSYITAIAAYNDNAAAQANIYAMLYPWTTAANGSKLYANDGEWTFTGRTEWVTNDYGYHTLGIGGPCRVETTAKGYFDGNEKTSGSDTLQRTGTIEYVSVGGNPTWFDEHIVGGTAFAALWNRELLAVEYKSLHANPWQIFKPRDIFIGKPEDRRVVVF